MGVPFDIVVAVGVLALFVLFNYTVGKNRSSTMLLAMYLAGAMIMLAPVIDILPEVSPIDARWLPIVEFVVIGGLMYFILGRCRYFDPYIVPSGWELGLFAFLQAVLALAIIVSLQPAAVTSEFSPNFARVFLDPIVRSVLIVGPMLVFLFIRGRD